MTKVHILTDSSAYQYEVVPLGQGSVLRDVFLNEYMEEITVATSSEQGSQIFKLSLANCSNYLACEECIGPLGQKDGDPYCGWCTLLGRCSSCVTRPWPCDWCIYENRCTPNSSTCSSDSTILGTNNPLVTGNRGQEYCPQLLGVHEEILVPVGVSTAYTLLAKHLPTDQRKYVYNEELLLKSVSVSVRWNGNKNIDDVMGTQVTLYKCSVNSESCGRCLSPEVTPARLGCGWCGHDCNVAGSDVCKANEFLNQSMYLQCNGPVITSIFPASGPLEGNTRLEIRGKNLGLTFSHIARISIGDSDCDLANMESFYEPGLSVSCMTSPHDRISAEKIQIVVTLSDGERTAYFEEPFYFRDPTVIRFNPTKGHAAGGTRITIYGEFLDTGRNISARLGKSKCIDLTYEGSEASCTTTAVSEGAQSLIMTFDGVDRFSPDAFTVLPNPVVTSVYRRQTIMSGGLHMLVTGERFDVVQESRIISHSPSMPDTKLELTDVEERIKKYGIPFRYHNQYVTVMFFGELGVRPETSDPEFMAKFVEESLVCFNRSLKDEEFIVAVIKTLEMKRQNEQRIRELIASLLSLVYVSEGKSIYFSKLISRLVRDRVAATSRSSIEMDALFGRSKSIVDKLLANWIALCMFPYIKHQMIYPMFMLYQALKSPCEKGPVDATTGEAYFTLDYNRLFDQDITFQDVVLFIVDEDNNAFLSVKVLDVDSVGQAKQKILDSMWKAGLCLLPRNGDALNVVWVKDAGTYLILRDDDEGADGHISGHVNTLKTYGLDHGCRIIIRPKGEATADSRGYFQLVSSALLSKRYENLTANKISTTPDPGPPKQSKPGATHLKLKMDDTTTPVHVTQGYAGLGRDLAVSHMLTTKAAVSPYVTNILESMFKFPQKFPLPVKHLFDIFDELSREYAVGANNDMAERWKRNCLTQFWVGLLTSIPSLFDMPRSDPVDQCLNVLVDAINHATRGETPPENSKQQPYFGDYSTQSRMVASFCNDVAGLPKVRQTKLFSACAKVTKEFRGHFSHRASLLQLFNLTKHDLQDMLQCGVWLHLRRGILG
ncbi:plexin-A4-like [Diadema setosum]|uniref:plexin-A4-like n=1 Tax=Diadema setosum TaxID=31175 RepID=UPI003B3A0536